MRKILSLLLILALFLPCALAETPQGIDLALTSTYGDADAFAEPRPARRGFSPDRPSFLGNREKKGE